MDFNRLQKDGMLDAKWFNLYGPYRQDGIFKSIRYAYKMGTDVEEYFLFGRVFASAKFFFNENPQSGIKNVSDTPQERKKKYNFWLDIYELTIEGYNGNDSIIIEYQINNLVLRSEVAIYNHKSKKFSWKKEDRRFNKVTLELPEDLNQLPKAIIRIIKKGTSIFSRDAYIGYKKFELKNLIDKKDVKPTWNKIRKCETTIENPDEAENLLGDILCALNCFQSIENQLSKRPLLYDTKTFKKYKLIAIIYMGKNFPKTGSNSKLFCEIKFYNPNTPKITEQIPEDSNPEWTNILFITAMLNEGLELSDNIRLFAKQSGLFGSDKLIGSTEIPVVEIDTYNHQNYIEKDVYKKAKWYDLENQLTNTKCSVLTRFLLVRLQKQESEKIDLGDRKLIPENQQYLFLIFIIGVRNLPTSVRYGACQVSYNKIPFELAFDDKGKIKDGKEMFDNNNEHECINHYNNYDVCFFLFLEYSN